MQHIYALLNEIILLDTFFTADDKVSRKLILFSNLKQHTERKTTLYICTNQLVHEREERNRYKKCSKAAKSPWRDVHCLHSNVWTFI